MTAAGARLGLTEGGHFPGYFLGGFECSTKVRLDGRRLDLLESTGHARLYARDYQRLVEHGIRGARDGFRWHLIEKNPGQYDWSSIEPMLKASRNAGIRVIWDLCHYGWPNWLDIWSPRFIRTFARYAAEAAKLVLRVEGPGAYYCPINEISFWAWAGGDAALFEPAARRKGSRLKRQLAAAAIAATKAIKKIDSDARFICAEPVIQVTPGSGDADEVTDAENARLSQFEAVDMLLGKTAPELGGAPGLIDLIGLNYYPDNQWYFNGGSGGFIPMGHYAYRPLREILGEVHERYGKPLLIAETGAEGTARAAWLHYVGSEVAAALRRGVPMEGMCIYPILDYPGWYDERHCAVGLFSMPGLGDERTADAELVSELKRQQQAIRSLHARAA